MGITRSHEVVFASIADTETTSDRVQLTSVAAGSVFFPADFTGTTYSIQGSHDGTNFKPIFNKDGSPLDSLTATADAWHELPPGIFPQGFIRIVAGSPQATDVTLTFQLKT